MMKKLIVAMALMIGVGVMVPVAETYADGLLADGQTVAEDCEKSIFGMRPWYSGLVIRDSNNRCVVGTPADDKAPAFVWTIVLNILFDAFSILGVVSVAFIILGGYWYLRSGGDPSLVERGKKTLQAAVVGTAIALVATLVTNLLTTILTNS